MSGNQRSQKMFVRKHYDSYWKILGDRWNGRSNDKDTEKTKDKDKEKGKGREIPEPHFEPLFPSGFAGQNFQGGNFGGPQHSDPDEEDGDFEPIGNAMPTGGASEVRWGAQGGGPAGPAAPGRFVGNQAQQGGLPSAMPPMPNLRHLQPGELRANMQRGGQTGFGERIRGLEGPSVYVGSEMPEKQGGGGGGERISGTGVGRRPLHPWLPETKLYEQEKTRQKKREEK